MLALSEEDVSWLLANLPMGTPVLLTFPGLRLDVDRCPEAADAIRQHWASAFI